MELVKSLTVDSAPPLTQLFRFALITSLELLKACLLLFPLNLAIFVIIVMLVFHKIITLLLPKRKFSKMYKPLKHNQSSPEQVKALKKQIRDVQSDLIQILKKSRVSQEQNKAINGNTHHAASGISNQSSVFQSCIQEGKEKTEMLNIVEQQLKRTVVRAYDEVSKVKNM